MKCTASLSLYGSSRASLLNSCGSQQGADGSTRAFNSFALRTRELEPGTCSLEVLDYFDMRGWFPV